VVPQEGEKAAPGKKPAVNFLFWDAIKKGQPNRPAAKNRTSRGSVKAHEIIKTWGKKGGNQVGAPASTFKKKKLNRFCSAGRGEKRQSKQSSKTLDAGVGTNRPQTPKEMSPLGGIGSQKNTNEVGYKRKKTARKKNWRRRQEGEQKVRSHERYALAKKNQIKPFSEKSLKNCASGWGNLLVGSPEELQEKEPGGKWEQSDKVFYFKKKKVPGKKLGGREKEGIKESAPGPKEKKGSTKE